MHVICNKPYLGFPNHLTCYQLHIAKDTVYKLSTTPEHYSHGATRGEASRANDDNTRVKKLSMRAQWQMCAYANAGSC
ncbi:hypothetical protein J1614_000892 [Plenodomus biglobosus]|nr:hypothetical protein J1614_000892 [Plenodomus biglobosus]